MCSKPAPQGVDEIIDGGHEDISKWYPGDDYVDWMALSWFMNPNERSIVPAARLHTDVARRAMADEVLQLAREEGQTRHDRRGLSTGDSI